jgi:hypothetical protein
MSTSNPGNFPTISLRYLSRYFPTRRATNHCLEMLQEIAQSGKTKVEWELLMPVLATLVHLVCSPVFSLSISSLHLCRLIIRTRIISITGMDLLDHCLNLLQEDMQPSFSYLSRTPVLRGPSNALLSSYSILAGSIPPLISS